MPGQPEGDRVTLLLENGEPYALLDGADVAHWTTRLSVITNSPHALGEFVPASRLEAVEAERDRLLRALDKIANATQADHATAAWMIDIACDAAGPLLHPTQPKEGK